MEQIKNKITENSGLVNMAINLAILFFLFSVASGIKDLKQEIGAIKDLIPAEQSLKKTEDKLRKQIIETLIIKLNEVQ